MPVQPNKGMDTMDLLRLGLQYKQMQQYAQQQALSNQRANEDLEFRRAQESRLSETFAANKAAAAQQQQQQERERAVRGNIAESMIPQPTAPQAPAEAFAWDVQGPATPPDVVQESITRTNGLLRDFAGKVGEYGQALQRRQSIIEGFRENIFKPDSSFGRELLGMAEKKEGGEGGSSITERAKEALEQFETIMEERPLSPSENREYSRWNEIYKKQTSVLPGQFEAAKMVAEMEAKEKRGELSSEEKSQLSVYRGLGLLHTTAYRNKLYDREERHNALPAIMAVSSRDPNAAYRDGWKMNDDGQPYVGLDGLPVKLPEPHVVLGKRGTIEQARIIAELRDDSIELLSILEDPQAAALLAKNWEEGFFNNVLNMTRNELELFLEKKGIGTGDAMGEIIWRVHRLASDERKRYLGQAVTLWELDSVKSWMPEAGMNFRNLLQRVELMAYEADDEFRNFLNIYKNQANMSHWYDAFGLDRFDPKPVGRSRAEELPLKGYRGSKPVPPSLQGSVTPGEL